MAHHKVLVADDQEVIRSLLSRSIQDAGYDVITASDGEEAIELYKLEHPSLVISDIQMPKKNGLVLLNEIKKIDMRAFVILITGFGSEETLLQALRGGAINFFKKPFKVEEVVDVIHHVLRHRGKLSYPELATTALTDEEKKFVIIPLETNLLPIINQITLNIGSRFQDAEIINLRIGIEEMLINAIEHGCLNIGFEEKNQALNNGTFSELLKEKRAQLAPQQRRVFVHTSLCPEEFTVTVRDEGRGFDWRSLPSPSTKNLLHFNGRGIFLTKIFFDKVEYNQAGNAVTLRKKYRLPG